jgi:hypothetical protein
VLAKLGENAKSIEADVQALSTSASKVTEKPGYKIFELVSPAFTVKEFVSPSSQVFAVSWIGIAHPDEKVLLGSYSDETKSSGAFRVRGSRKLEMTSENIVFKKWGHSRKVQGLAYIPSLLPEGVKPDEIE